MLAGVVIFFVMSEKILIFDTTLRDGEQSPGASLNVFEKLEIAKQLEKLKVDIIEAGFPVSSPAQFEAVKRISGEVNLIIAALVLYITSLMLGDEMQFRGFWGVVITAVVVGLLNFFIPRPQHDQSNILLEEVIEDVNQEIQALLSIQSGNHRQ